MKTITAIYEQGVLRLTQPLELPEGTEVQVAIITNRANAPKGNAASILAAIASPLNETANSEGTETVNEA